MTQGDTVVFKAIPTDGGDFATNEPAWSVTGDSVSSTGEWRFQTFGTYRAPGATIVSVGTPVDTSPKTVTITLVPYPTGISATAIKTPIENFLTQQQYGTRFVHTLAPSAGATGEDLYDFYNPNDYGLLYIKEYVTFNAPYNDPPIELPMEISPGGKMFDYILTDVGYVFPLSEIHIPGGDPLVSPQDFLWQSGAQDSLNRGWHEFVTDNPVAVSLAASQNGWVVTTTDNGVPFSQPLSAPGLEAHLVTPSPATIPWGSYITVTLTGTVRLTADDVDAGFKTFEVTLYDDDSPGNDPLQSVTVTVPAAFGFAGMYTPWSKQTILMNLPVENGLGQIWGVVGGGLGHSGEVTAEVFFWAPGADIFDYSNIVSVTAAPMP